MRRGFLILIFLASGILFSECNYFNYKILDQNGKKLGEKMQYICFYKDFNVIFINEKYKIEKEILFIEMYIYSKLEKIEDIRNYFIKQYFDIEVPIKIIRFNKRKKDIFFIMFDKDGELIGNFCNLKYTGIELLDKILFKDKDKLFKNILLSDQNSFFFGRIRQIYNVNEQNNFIFIKK